jgi:hypothetical protein
LLIDNKGGKNSRIALLVGQTGRSLFAVDEGVVGVGCITEEDKPSWILTARRIYPTCSAIKMNGAQVVSSEPVSNRLRSQRNDRYGTLCYPSWLLIRWRNAVDEEGNPRTGNGVLVAKPVKVVGLSSTNSLKDRSTNRVDTRRGSKTGIEQGRANSGGNPLVGMIRDSVQVRVGNSSYIYGLFLKFIVTIQPAA